MFYDNEYDKMFVDMVLFENYWFFDIENSMKCSSYVIVVFDLNIDRMMFCI